MKRANRQRGAATLGAALLLTMLLVLAVLYAHRGLLFEQRSAANQLRAAQAFEVAEAGVDWATAMLNDPRTVDDSCTPAAGSESFRTRYLSVDPGGALHPRPGAAPACRWRDDTVACACPGGGADAADEDDGAPRFGTTFEAVDGEPSLMRLSARGCIGGAASCMPGSASEDSDATAESGVVLRWVPGLSEMPVAAVTAGGSVQLGGGVTVSNPDAERGGRLVHAGGEVTVTGSATLLGPAGTPSSSLIHEHDATLGSRDMAVSLVGTDVAAWARRPIVKAVRGASPAERGAAVLAAHAQGFRAFLLDADVLLDADSIGSGSEPLLLVSAHRVACARPCRLHGLVYGDVAIRAAADLQNVTVRGAVVTRGHHVQASSGGVEYDAGVLQRLRELTAILVKVPGSWSDLR